MDLKSFHRALEQIAEARGISPEAIIETIEAAIATAYKKITAKRGKKLKLNSTRYRAMLSFGK